MRLKHYYFLLLIGISSCAPTTEYHWLQEATAVTSPTGETAQTPQLFATDQHLYLSWLEGTKELGHQLRYAVYQDKSWTVQEPVARGKNWFVNWADFPSLIAYQDGALAAHWLAMRDTGTYDYDVHIAIKQADAATWSRSFLPHRDSISAEHGFVSMQPLTNGNVLAVWLDGRNTKGSHAHATEHAGAMTLRSAEFDTQGRLYREAEIDSRVCDCCQTDLALTPTGAIVVYRDRSTDEIRDMSYALYENGHWTSPQNLHADNWQIKGCPVNGPAISSLKNSIVTAWYTAAGQQAKIQVSFSGDAGKSFGDAILVPTQSPLGRVDVTWLTDEIAVVSWLEKQGTEGLIKLAVIHQSGQVLQEKQVGTTEISRSSGFPVMVRFQKQLFLAWTVPGKPSHIELVTMTLNYP